MPLLLYDKWFWSKIQLTLQYVGVCFMCLSDKWTKSYLYVSIAGKEVKYPTHLIKYR